MMDNKPETNTLEKILSGLETTYMVPEYQRDYAWTRNNVDELWDDIMVSYQNDSRYFMGTIVLNSENKKEDEFDIVDGQQRLATFTIFFSVVRAFMNHFQSKPDDDIFQDLVNNEANKSLAKKIADIAHQRMLHTSDPDHYYLKLNKKDLKVFDDEILKCSEPLRTAKEWKIVPNESRLIKAKKTFSSKIAADFLCKKSGIEDLYACLVHVIKRLTFWTIKVESDTDAYLLFESLNSKGLDLSISDLLKNKMLMICGNDQQKKEAILARWEEMMGILEESRFSPVEFFRFYWIAFYKVTTKKELYTEIKKVLTSGNVEEMSKRFLEYSEYFSDFTKKDLLYPSTNYKPKSIERFCAEINTLGYSVCYPLFFQAKAKRPELLNKLASRSIDFLFRLITIGELSVGKADEAFSRAAAYIKDGKTDDEILGLFDDPEIEDSKFKDKFIQRRYDNKLGKYILARIYEFEKGSELTINTSDINLEHIMPIGYKDHWSNFDRKGRDWDDWIYNIGNFTLLNEVLNQKAANKAFDVKVMNYYCKREDSSDKGTVFPLTYELNIRFKTEKYDWTADEISQRAKEFSEKAKDIWKN